MSDEFIPLLCTPTEAARHIGISPRKLRDLMAAGRIETHDLDGRHRIHRNAILSFVGSLARGYAPKARPPASRNA
jgi:excisionase family DNA binding protein